ncbi:hypothetical protein [Halorarius litoreus]|uniref:hypothetical protein n=1 Tax=Halorarius litoreus TaxID=2962676 RepID=UPI0020CC8120|nr:hypothetical protein [Halorarius litoreus]
MVPLQSLPGAVVGLGALLLLVLGPGVVASVLWTPFLASTRLRSLFRRLPPDGSLAVTYAVVTVGASLPYVLGAGVALGLVDIGGPEGGARMANAILTVIVPVSLGYVLGVPLVGAVGLPRAGVDWDPTGYGVSTWLLLFVGTVWYVVLFAVPLFVLALIAAYPG